MKNQCVKTMKKVDQGFVHGLFHLYVSCSFNIPLSSDMFVLTACTN